MSNIVPFNEMQAMAAAFAKSGMFGAKTPEQAMALLLLAQGEGLHPAIAMRDFDIIQGRPAKKAEAMLRSFIAAGGSVEWHKLDDTCADATFSHPQGGTARISWDLARAKRAGISNKDNYNKYPRQMLRSRVVSEGCRTIYPASTSGLYVPEEVVQFKRAPEKEKDMGKIERVISEAQHKRLEAKIAEMVIDREKVKTLCVERFSKEHFTDLTPDEYQQLDEALPDLVGESQPKAAAAPPPAESSASSSEPAGGAAAPARTFAFYYPGADGPQDQAESPEEWFQLWQRLCDTIVKSARIDSAEKDKKIRDLRKANDPVVKRLGPKMMGQINADIAKRSRELKDAAIAEPAK